MDSLDSRKPLTAPMELARGTQKLARNYANTPKNTDAEVAFAFRLGLPQKRKKKRRRRTTADHTSVTEPAAQSRRTAGKHTLCRKAKLIRRGRGFVFPCSSFPTWSH
jgi:hypothetical protein